ncbi:hypothetical protein [Pollutibacter soli]|uniref:hypothetical protein n=1 Tax=Pollutibacter soli TaxID=3034157 RepID=UPI0030132610
MSAYELIDNPNFIDKNYIACLLNQGATVTVQFSDAIYTRQMLSDLNEICNVNDERFSIRFYGHRSSTFDCHLFHDIPDVKSLVVDPEAVLVHTDAFTHLSSLKSFSLDPDDLDNKNFFSNPVFAKLEKLSIGNTARNDINLEYLGSMTKLKILILHEQTKNIEAIGGTVVLEKLTLNKIKKVKLDFVNKLRHLHTLRLLLGSREDIGEIEENNIECLEMVLVRGFNNLSGLSAFKKLRQLRFEDLAQLQSISFGESQQTLEELKIANCKSLEEINGLAQLKNLSSLFINVTSIDFDDMLNRGLPSSLKNFSFYTGKSKRDQQIKTELKKSGYSVS